jgi:NADH dehydrogenase
MPQLDVVTGAFGYTGRRIAARLLDDGRRVRSLTFHPDRPNPLDGEVEVVPYSFDDPDALARSLQGADTLYNTYWVRFDHGGTTFTRAVENSRRLFEAAARAGVRRVVHVSITNPSADSPLPYFRGKALVERAVAGSGVSYAIVRPTVVFGTGDVLVNNIAWLARRVPVFAIPGDGRYRVRPVHVDDVARLCVSSAAVEAPEALVLDAVGPEVLTFEDMVVSIRDAVGGRARLIHVPPALIPPLTWLVGLAVRDTLLTRHELEGLTGELVHSDGPATGEIGFSRWVAGNAGALGMRYASELARHFRSVGAAEAGASAPASA